VNFLRAKYYLKQKIKELQREKKKYSDADKEKVNREIKSLVRAWIYLDQYDKRKINAEVK